MSSFIRKTFWKKKVESLPGRILITDLNGKILYTNKAMSSNELWGGHMNVEFYNDMWKTLRTKKLPFVGEVINIDRRGIEFRKTIHISPILNDQHSIEYFIEIQPEFKNEIEKRKFQKEFKKYMGGSIVDGEKLLNQLVQWLSDDPTKPINEKEKSDNNSTGVLDLPTLLEWIFLSYGESARLDDAQWVSICKTNPEAFEHLYNKYRDRIYNYIYYRVSRNRTIAEEILQETFLRAFHAIKSFEQKDVTYLSYLLVIAHNLLINFYRSNRTISLEDMSYLGEYEPNFQDPFEHKKIQRVLKSLSSAERLAILLKYKADQSIKQIARKMEKTENAIKLLLSRARQKVRKWYF